MYMLKLNLPQNMLEKEQYLALASNQKGEYIHNLLREILELNPKGITISQIDKATYLGRATIWHHLEVLASRGECMKIERGDTEVFHSNKVIVPLEELDINSDYYTYWFHVVENTYGKFIHIQAKQQDKSGNVITHSGVILQSNVVDDVINSLNKIKEIHLNKDEQK